MQDKAKAVYTPKSFIATFTFAQSETDYKKLEEEFKKVIQRQHSLRECSAELSEYHHMKRLQIQIVSISLKDSWAEWKAAFPDFATYECLKNLLTKLGPIRDGREEGGKRGGSVSGWYEPGSNEVHTLIKSFVLKAQNTDYLSNRELSDEKWKGNKHTHTTEFKEIDNPPFYNKNVEDKTLRSLELHHQIRNVSAREALGKLPNLEWNGCVMDVEYYMDDMDELSNYTSTDEFEDFIQKFKYTNKAKNYTVCVFLGARQVEDFREVLLRFFEKVERRYWYKVDRTYTLPGPDKVSSQIEHFLLAYHRPRGEPWARWQFDFEPGETSNVFECPVVVRGLSLGGRVSKQLFSIFFCALVISG